MSEFTEELPITEAPVLMCGSAAVFSRVKTGIPIARKEDGETVLSG